MDIFTTDYLRHTAQMAVRPGPIVPKILPTSMDYRAQGSWIGNVRGRLGKAGYGGSDVACILVCIFSVMRVRGPTAIYRALAA